jgi:hypothetical protein
MNTRKGSGGNTMAERDEDLSNVPNAVLKQQKAAEKLVEQISAKPEDNPVKEVVVVNKTEAQIAAEAAAVAPIDQPAIAPAIIDTNDKDAQWEHKYSVLQGKYNKEVGDLRDKLSEIELSFNRQTKIIEDLNSKKAVPTSAANADTSMGDLDPEDFEGWGKEMKDMVVMVNKLNAVIRDQSEIINGLKTSGPKGGAQEGDMSQRVETIEQEMGKTRSDRYTQALDSTIKGDWRAINKDPKFISWLNVVDPISGVPRMNHLQAAAQELRGDQVSSIFNQYIEVAGITPTKPISFVDDIPVGGGGGEPIVEGNAVRLTAADIQKAQQDHIQGRITEAEYDKIYSDYQKELRRQQKA